MKQKQTMNSTNERTFPLRKPLRLLEPFNLLMKICGETSLESRQHISRHFLGAESFYGQRFLWADTSLGQAIPMDRHFLWHLSLCLQTYEQTPCRSSHFLHIRRSSLCRHLSWTDNSCEQTPPIDHEHPWADTPLGQKPPISTCFPWETLRNSHKQTLPLGKDLSICIHLEQTDNCLALTQSWSLHTSLWRDIH